MRQAFPLLILSLAGCKEPLVVKSYLSLIHISPSSGADGVSVDTQIVATFSEDLDPDSVDVQTAYLEDATAMPVVTSVTYDEATRAIIVFPEVPLAEGTQYTATFTSDITGKESGGLNAVVSSDFTTGGGALYNSLPIADAGADQQTEVDTKVNLDGRASADPEGADLTYAWRLVSGPAGSESALTKDDASRTALTPDQPGEYIVGLTVNDGIEDSSEDFVSIQATSRTEEPGDPEASDTGTAEDEDTGA